MRPLFEIAVLRKGVGRTVKSGSTVEQRALMRVSLWAEVIDGEGRRAVSRHHGPEAGGEWTALGALSAVWGEIGPDRQDGADDADSVGHGGTHEAVLLSGSRRFGRAEGGRSCSAP